MKYYTIYRITNLVNGKTYIGKHVTSKVDDDYMGSGKHLTRAISKYGAENFAKTILHIYSTEAEMNARERELVTEAWCLRDDTYNLCVGGQGGFSYINRASEFRASKKRKAMQAATKTMQAKYGITNPGQLPQTRAACSNNMRTWLLSGKHKFDTFRGKKHSEETKQKMSVSLKGLNVGEKNSQAGTMWITDGTENKKIKKVDSVPKGWYTGRVIKKTPL